MLRDIHERIRNDVLSLKYLMVYLGKCNWGR